MKNVADIYPLTPTQAGILYHTLHTPQDDLYFQQMSCDLQGDLDIDTFRHAWEEVVARHPVLRTIFLWEGVNEPLQVVRQTVTVPWDIQDWRGVPAEEQAARIAALGREYRTRGFDLTKAPLLHMVLIQLTDDRFHFLWNFHHLLTDGWSTHLVFHEAFATYDLMMRGEEPAQLPVRPFRDYIDWLRRQDMDTAENFWREHLAGFAAANPFQVDQPAQGLAIQHGEAILVLPADVTNTLKEIARQNRLTLNTVVQGAWSILLSRYSGEEDILFGTTLSGRPAELRGVENMVGMFINTLPLRVKVADDASLLPWLQELQTQQLQIRNYEYSSLARIQRFSDIEPGQPLFESIVVFENYPMDTRQEHILEITDIEYREQSNYPLALLVLPGEEMRLLAIYDQSRFSADTIDRMLNHLRTILASMAADPQRNVGELPLMETAEAATDPGRMERHGSANNSNLLGSRSDRGACKRKSREDGGHCQQWGFDLRTARPAFQSAGSSLDPARRAGRCTGGIVCGALDHDGGWHPGYSQGRRRICSARSLLSCTAYCFHP